MESTKYFDHQHRRIVDLEKDGCDLNKWQEQYGAALFARHPKGFLIFLQPHELGEYDEYKKSDPYTVEENITNDFHKRRIDCTLEMIGEAAKQLQLAPRILDLGCGQGHITSKILKAYPEAEISGLDYSISAIEYAADHFSGIDFAVGNAYKSPYSENYFDIVVCNNLWEHVPDPLVLLAGIKTIIKPRGFVIISTPSRYRLENLIKILRGKPIRFMSKHHVTEYTVGQLIEQLRYGGFELVKLTSRPINHSGLKASIASAIFSLAIFLTGSHHCLESTVFYLAQRAD